MNLKEIFDLMDRFDKSSLAEIKVTIADTAVTLRKPSAQPVFSHAYAPPPVPAPSAHSPVPAHQAEPAPAKKEGVEIVTSPIVGTFYRAAAPDTPPFVDVGTKIATGDTICIIEAMKVMNRLEAEFKMEIVAILVENGQMVEYGTPLYEVKRI